MTYKLINLKTDKKDHGYITSAFILMVIKAGLRSNSGLLEVKLTQRTAKINVLDDDCLSGVEVT